jgi:hypothetical protein
MREWDSPQNSAHWPQKVPGLLGVMWIQLYFWSSPSGTARRGLASRLPPSMGTQKEWITSSDQIRAATGLPHRNVQLVRGNDVARSPGSGTPTSTGAR